MGCGRWRACRGKIVYWIQGKYVTLAAAAVLTVCRLGMVCFLETNDYTVQLTEYGAWRSL
jgi:hypothetical protein